MQTRTSVPDRQLSMIGRGTEKLYYTDAYMKEFDAAVLQCEPLADAVSADGEKPHYAVVLDRTAFFPEEGGQSPDRGTLEGIREVTASLTDPQMANRQAQVLDVQIREGIITHVTDQPFSPGTRVHGTLDFEHRFSNMQQHSAEHLCSGLVWSRLGLSNVGFHLSDTEVTMDYSGPISPEEAAALEAEVNQIIWQNIESRQEFPSPEELQARTYRSKSEIEGQVRLIIFPGCDVCACCAPHVARTGEIGLFRILSVQSHRGGVRVHMLAGARALRHLTRQTDILTASARSLSTSSDQVPVRIERLRAELADTRRALSEARLALLLKETDALPPGQASVCLFTEGLEEPVLRQAVNQLMEQHEGACAIFNGTDASGYRYVLGSRADVSAIQRLLRDTLGARGGGKPPMVQGQVHAGHAAITAVFDQLIS